MAAAWLALPPLESRSAALPLLFGLLAVAAGIWAWTRDQRRVGGGAIISGIFGIALGLFATKSSTAHLDQVVVWSALGAATLRYATPLTFAAIGGLYCERSGVINVALEGMLLTGAYFGIFGAIETHSWAGKWAWVFGILFVFFYLCFLVWQTYYAILTSNRTSWGTRPSQHIEVAEGST